jgi:hypothetical protein
MINNVITLVSVSAYLYRQTMTTIKEIDETMQDVGNTNSAEPELFPWLEFVTGEQDHLKDLYNLFLESDKLKPELTEEEEGDPYWAKTWILNKIAIHHSNKFAPSTERLRTEISTNFTGFSPEELDELQTVPDLLRRTLESSLDYRKGMKNPSISEEERMWRRERLGFCNVVKQTLVSIRQTACAARAREKQNNLSRLDVLRERMGNQKAFGPLVPFVDDDLRRQWHQTGDDGSWVHDDGTTWDEDEHGGMRPFDEAGDTESEEDDDEMDQSGDSGVPIGDCGVEKSRTGVPDGNSRPWYRLGKGQRVLTMKENAPYKERHSTQ